MNRGAEVGTSAALPVYLMVMPLASNDRNGNSSAGAVTVGADGASLYFVSSATMLAAVLLV